MVIHATRVDYRNAFAGLVFPASKDEIVRRSRMIGGIDRDLRDPRCDRAAPLRQQGRPRRRNPRGYVARGEDSEALPI